MSKLEKLLQGVDVKWKALGDICIIKTGQSINKIQIDKNPGIYPVINSGKEPLGYINNWNTEDDPIGIASRGAGVGQVTWTSGKYFRGNLNYSVTILDKSIIQNKYLFYVLLSMQMQIHALCTFDGIPALNSSNLKKLLIPIPPIEIQQEIVRVLDELTSLTNQLTTELETERQNRKKQFEFFREQLFRFEEGENNYVALGELAENLDSKRKPITSSQRKPGKIPYYGASGIVDYVEDYIFDGDYLLVSEDGANLLARSTPIAFSISGKNWVNNHAHILKFETKYERLFVEYYLNSIDLAPYITGAAQPKLNKKNLNSIKIPNPALEEKERIVKLLDQLDATHTAIEEEITKEIKLRTQQYEYYREKLLSFPSLRTT